MKTQHPMDLTGKVALVTGGSSGIGLGLATGIAKAGGDLVIWGRRADRNEAAAESLRAFGGRVVAMSVDVSDESAVDEGFQDAVAEIGRIDAVFANAGFFAPSGPIEDLDMDAYRELIATDQIGVVHTVRGAAAHMIARARAGDPGGSIVVTSSAGAISGAPQSAAYASAKGAIISLALSLAIELAPHGIRTNCLVPGFIHSELVPGGIEGMQEQVKRRTGGVGIADRDALEGIAIYLTSDSSYYHNGDTITIDGGYTIAFA